MTEPPRRVIVALLLLTFVTGIVDAASVLGLGRIFAANMTGNVVFLGFALAGQHAKAAVIAGLNALGSFMAGAVLGGRLSKVITPRSLTLAFGIELLLLGVATAVALVDVKVVAPILISLLGLAMGLRNAVVRRLAIPDLTTTVLTLTVTGLASDSSLAGGSNPRWQRRVAAILVMLLGALLGATLLSVGMAAVIASATLVEAIALVLLARGAEAKAEN
ncbi:hypothetical protein AKJ09_05382 [Labilithrix luteola]|uniref:DUF1275 domain-containing protein n=1 Tax=Labilithrix luteola TaxID=1391654 RepID=A0A0K1PYX7_9BACT|nr:YoaK family protein [Labilithrix luteola]AKU98718.1 hypothetical protein AKJ09_05382 [Labilithrix luteola]